MAMLLLLLGVIPAFADPVPVVFEVGGARLDWTTLVLTLDEEGAPPPGGREEYQVIEQRVRTELGPRMLEAAGQVRIDAATRARDLLAADTPLAAVLGQTSSAWDVSEARYHTSGKVALTAVLDLRTWLTPVLRARALPDDRPAGTPSNFTGVLVDARGLPAEGALAPRILSADGAVLYGAERVLESVARKRTPVQYVSDPADPRAWERAGDHPLLLRAAAVQDEVDLRLGPEDSVRLQTTSQDSTLLSEARVVLVLGP